ncbi:MAG: glutamine-hydrolyzing GMP synthase [candidate division Zixibacteria bacterium]|nr:glutamine-hydrolyzing GMP synthase [candidate division Zixibacteria bacterium]
MKFADSSVKRKIKQEETIIILDFGSQYTQLIARRIRENRVFCEIIPFNQKTETYKHKNLKGIILSGGPASIFDQNAPFCEEGVFEFDVPVLGICYGLQLIGKMFGGEMERSMKREYGKAIIETDNHEDLFSEVKDQTTVWMSHGDHLSRLPKGFEVLAHTESIPFAAIRNKEKEIFGLQFHPEVVHTQEGKKIIHNFLFNICRCEGTWTAESFIESSVSRIKDEVGGGKVVLGLSGGVDSSVCAMLVNKAIGKQLNCIFVDNGLLRKNEVKEVVTAFKHFDLNLICVDASQRFLNELKGVTDPEEKRKIIGKVFIDVFEEEARKIRDVEFLTQGTLYPDVIESTSFRGPSATIKSHHNVGGLPEEMNLKLIEPLRELFKDEVREIGRRLKLPKNIIGRHPFPGPGLAVRILGQVTKERLFLLREADDIFICELKKSDLYNEIWQAFCVLLPVLSVGVMGDERTYENVIALRAVTSVDGMTADWAKLPYETLEKISSRIINEVKGVNRTVYDVSSKPPATIEWE